MQTAGEHAGNGAAPLIDDPVVGQELTLEELPKTKIIVLDPPIEFNNKTYSELVLEEPTTAICERAEQELANSMSVLAMRRHQIALVAGAAKVPAAVIRSIRISQLVEASDFLAQFKVGGFLTGVS